MAFVALLDANVLYPAALRDTLLRMAEAGFYRPLWSERILEEMQGGILRRYPDLTEERLAPTLEAMRMAFPDAAVSGYAALVPAMENHPNDQHVLAAAVVGRADVLVTSNVRHFPVGACDPFGIEVQTPDEFLVHLFHLDPEATVDVLEEQASDKQRPPMTPDELLDSLDRSAPELVAEVRRFLGG